MNRCCLYPLTASGGAVRGFVLLWMFGALDLPLTASSKKIPVIWLNSEKQKKSSTNKIKPMSTIKSEHKSIASGSDLSAQRLYHGTKANLKQGDLVQAAFTSNHGKRRPPTFI